MTRRTAERLELRLAAALTHAYDSCSYYQVVGDCEFCRRWAWQEATGEDCDPEDFEDDVECGPYDEDAIDLHDWRFAASERARA